jgi:hypothetical protein
MDLFFKAKGPKRAADAAAAAAEYAKRAKTGATDTAAGGSGATSSGSGGAGGAGGGGSLRRTVHKVVFKYNQGFSDAVRRPVTVAEFL